MSDVVEREPDVGPVLCVEAVEPPPARYRVEGASGVTVSEHVEIEDALYALRMSDAGRRVVRIEDGVPMTLVRGAAPPRREP